MSYQKFQELLGDTRKFITEPAPRDPEHNLLQISCKKTLTAVVDTALSCQLICLLHSNGHDSAAHNPYFQVISLIAIDSLLRAALHGVERIKPFERLTNIKEIATTSFCSGLALASGLIHTSISSAETGHSTDMDMKTLVIMLSVALGLKFLVWDMNLPVAAMKKFNDRNTLENIDEQQPLPMTNVVGM